MLLSYSKNSIKELALKSNKRRKFELDKTLDLEDFIGSLITDAKTNDPNFHGSNTLYKNEYPRIIRVAPSVKEMYSLALSVKTELDLIDADSKKTADDKTTEKLEILRETIKPKEIITLESRPDIWWGDTIKGINGRVGYVNNDRSKSFPFKIGGTQTHVCAGGNTGQGKSVMMDAFIQALLVEYPPWELGLFLVDMKMLEHAKYAASNKCPQIRDIGITGSSTYITSVLKFIDDEMKDFYSLCSIVGPNTIAGVREALNLYIPRCLIVMDEFSQLNENATNAEKMQVEFYLQSIAKLGRAVGYHMLPTSQTFRGAISKDTLGQFKVGMAVGSNDDNSEELIGNTGAVQLKEKVGYCIINQNRSTPKNDLHNMEYKVAFMDIEKPKDMIRFQKLLERVCDFSKSINITKEPTVFNEKTRRDYHLLSDDMKRIKKEFSQSSNKEDIDKCFLNVVLGNGTVYSGSTIPKIESFNLEYARNSNIFVSGIVNNDIKYILKLIGRNIDNYVKETGEKIFTKMIVDNSETYFSGIVKNYTQDLTGLFKLEAVYNSILKRELFLRFNLYAKSFNIEPVFSQYIKYLISNKSTKEVQREVISEEDLANMFEDDFLDLIEMYNSGTEDFSEMTEIQKKILSDRHYAEELLGLYNTYNDFMSQKKGKYFEARDFKKNIFFFFEPQLNDGIATKYGISDLFNSFLNKGPSVGVFSVVIIKDPKGMNSTVKSCTHILTGKPPASLKGLGIVTFLDKSGIALKYTKCDGDLADNKYFKKYLYVDDEFLTNE